MVSVQCPKCELQFSSPNVLNWHLRQDHRRSRGLASPERRSEKRNRRRRTRVNAAAWFRRQ